MTPSTAFVADANVALHRAKFKHTKEAVAALCRYYKIDSVGAKQIANHLAEKTQEERDAQIRRVVVNVDAEVKAPFIREERERKERAARSSTHKGSLRNPVDYTISAAEIEREQRLHDQKVFRETATRDAAPKGRGGRLE